MTKPKRSAIIKPSLIPASLYNKPLPRIYPQPLKISMMIKSRIAAKQKRTLEFALLRERLRELYIEDDFYKSLAHLSSYRFKVDEWCDLIKARLEELSIQENRAQERLHTPVSPELQQTLTEARKRRHRYYEDRAKQRKSAQSSLSKQPDPEQATNSIASDN